MATRGSLRCVAGWRRLVGVWPAVLVCGVSFSAVQFVFANFVGQALVDVVGGVASLVAVAVFLRVWRPREVWRHSQAIDAEPAAGGQPCETAVRIVWAWMPWAFLSVAVFVWGLPAVRAGLDGIAAPPEIRVPRLDGRVAKVPPATQEPQEIERAIYCFNWLSAAGTAIFAAALLSVPWLGISVGRGMMIWWATLRRLATALTTIALMLPLAFVTRYSETDVTLGLALTKTGPAYAFFAPLLTCTANSTGGVMGKMIDAQSIVVSATATGEHGREGVILRRVFPHSLSLVILMGVLVWLQSGPLAWMVP